MLLAIAFVCFFAMLVAWIMMPNSAEAPESFGAKEIAPAMPIPMAAD